MTQNSSMQTSQRGLSLVEVMIGLAIGLLVSLAIFQTLSLWSQRTRTTSSGNEAQIAGTIGIYRLDRDLKHAGMGFGLAPTELAGCDVETPDPAFTFQLAPLVIEPGATAADPDTLRVLYGESSYLTSGVLISGTGADTKQLVSRAGFHPGDWFVAGRTAAGAADCRLLEMTSTPLSADDGRTVEHKASTTYPYYYERHLSPAGSRQSSVNNTTADWAGNVGTVAWAFNLGNLPQMVVWTVGGGAAGNTYLRRSSELVFSAQRARTPSAPVEVAQGVVNLKAQYGVASNTGQITWTTTTPTDWTRLRAVRLALLVRSQNYEPPDPATNACVHSAGGLPNPQWFGTDFVMSNIGGGTGATLDAANWRCYRYRVYERIVPMRNMIWGTSSPL